MATYAEAASVVNPGDTDVVMSGGEGDQESRRSMSGNSSMAPPQKVPSGLVLKRTKAPKETGSRPDGAVPVPVPTGAKPPSTPTFNWLVEKEDEVLAKAKAAERKKAQKQKKKAAAAPAPLGVGGKRPHSDSPIKPDVSKRRSPSDLREESPSGSLQGLPERRRKSQAEMTGAEKSLDNQERRMMKKLNRKASEASLEPPPAQRAAGVKKPSAKALDNEATNHYSLDTMQYMDGLTVWVNHPTLNHPNPFEVADAVVAAVTQKHSASEVPSIVLTSVTSGGKAATVLRTSTEAVRRLFTEHHISAFMVDGQTKHHLQVQAYRGGGNTIFFLSDARIHAESDTKIVAAVRNTYPGEDFQVWQCAKGNTRSDCFFIMFEAAPARYHKQVPLELNKMGGGVPGQYGAGGPQWEV